MSWVQREDVCRVEERSGLRVDLATGEDKIDKAEGWSSPLEGCGLFVIGEAVKGRTANVEMNALVGQVAGGNINAGLAMRVDNLMINVIANFTRQTKERWQGMPTCFGHYVFSSFFSLLFPSLYLLFVSFIL